MGAGRQPLLDDLCIRLLGACELRLHEIDRLRHDARQVAAVLQAGEIAKSCEPLPDVRTCGELQAYADTVTSELIHILMRNPDGGGPGQHTVLKSSIRAFL